MSCDAVEPLEIFPSDIVLLLALDVVTAEPEDIGISVVVGICEAGADMDFSGMIEDGSAWRGRDLRRFRDSRCRWSACRFSVLFFTPPTFCVTCRSQYVSVGFSDAQIIVIP